MAPVGRADRRSSRQAAVTGGTIVTFLLVRCFPFPSAFVDRLSLFPEPVPCDARSDDGLLPVGAVGWFRGMMAELEEDVRDWR